MHEDPNHQEALAAPKVALSKKIGNTLIYLLFLATIAAIVLEVGIRLLMPQVLHRDIPEFWAPDEMIGWRHRPNQRLIANTGERDVEICTNALGDRISCTKEPRTHCTHRILVVGDSFVEALAIPFEQTAWSLLQEETKACLEVTGVAGYGPAQYLQMIQEKLAAPEADYAAILLSVYVNDLGPRALERPSPKEVQKVTPRLLPTGFTIAELRLWLYPLNQIVESHSHAYVAFRYSLRKLQDPGNVGVYGLPKTIQKSRFNEEMARPIREALIKLHRELQAKSIKLILTTIPYRNQVLDPRGDELRTIFPHLADDIDMELANRLFTNPMKNVPDLKTVDLLPLLIGVADKSYWGTQDQHFSPKGHEFWFQALLPAVESIVKTSAP